jgi:NTE family protein
MNDRALVLGGGGVAGIAWITGLLFGLSEEGVDLRSAELILGTSAGAAVAAQLGCPLSLEELYRRQVDPALQTREFTPDPRLLEQLLEAFPTVATSCDRAELTRKVGQWALLAPTVTEAERRSVVANRLPAHHWPDRLLRVTAVDTESGEIKIFDRHSGTPLVDAVAASCAVPGVWPPVTIGGRRYMDGGVRSSDNADLAKGYGRIVVVSPNGLRADEIVAFPLQEQIDVLKKGGAQTYVIEPDQPSRTAIGLNPLLPATRTPSAEAGRRQAKSIASEMKHFWN